MLIILYCFLGFIGLVVLVTSLSIKFFLHASGGSDEGFRFEVRVLAFNGFFGFGIKSEGRSFPVKIFLCSQRLFMFDITRAVKFISCKFQAVKKRLKKKKVKKPAIGVKKSIKTNLQLAREMFSVIKWVIREFKGLISFDSVSSHITLGLWRPDITGWISGLLIGLNGLLPEKFIIIPSWDFTRQVVQGDITLRFTVRSYIFWKKLVTSVPCVLYRKRRQIKSRLKTFKGKNSFQEV
ncbi:hypothetical protein ES707_21042 [subsurface metagenome]